MLWSYAVLAPVSKCYPPVRDRLFTRYSPVRHSNTSLPAEAFRNVSPFDLHVLSTPPAFVLSQDQTLMFNPSPLPETYSLRLAKASAFSLAPWRFTHRILTSLSLGSLAPRLPGSPQSSLASSFPLYRFQGSPLSSLAAFWAPRSRQLD